VTETKKSADPLDPLWRKAIEAAAQGDMPGVLFVWKSLAEKGVWQAYARIGEVYERGADGIEKDPSQAVSWYRKAVFEGDDPVAHIGLGRAYYNGSGVERDYEAAFKHFQSAHNYKLPESGIHLGLMYYRGVIVQRDVSKAKELFGMAASADYPGAYACLARIAFFEGKLLAAMSLFLKAVVLGVKIAKQDPSDPRLLGILK
jgi:hypothetical protein